MLNNLQNKTLILASQSPRRKDLLAGLDIDFSIEVKPVDETYPETLAATEIPVYLAEKKAAAYKPFLKENTILLTADTIVVQGTEVLEKPSNEEDARRMLTKLSGQWHTVVTGVSIVTTEETISFNDNTKVQFAELTADEIDYYIQKYKPFDKAGAYGIQEWIGYIGIEKLDGSYYTVMGLPVHKVYQALKGL